MIPAPLTTGGRADLERAVVEIVARIADLTSGDDRDDVLACWLGVYPRLAACGTGSRGDLAGLAEEANQLVHDWAQHLGSAMAAAVLLVSVEDALRSGY